MANTHVYPEDDTRLGGELKRLIEMMKDVKSETDQLVGIMAAIVGGTDWAALAAELGFTGEDAVTHVQSAYDLITLAQAYSIGTVSFTDVITKMG